MSQRSVLGPPLFCIFINDFHSSILLAVNCDIWIDTSLNTSDKDTDTVQRELPRSKNEVSDWCDNAMNLHPVK